MQHSFDVEIAQKYGIFEAILLEYFYFWTIKNEENKTNFFDGRYWTYISRSKLSELFPYATEKQVRYALEKLVRLGVLKVGNYNKTAFDRTLWYAFSDDGFSILHNCHLRNANSGTPIPVNRTVILPPYIPPKGETKKNNTELIEQIIDYLNKKGGTSFRTTSKKTVQLINARIKQGYTLDDFKDVIWHCYCEWVQQPFKFSNGQMSDTYFRPSTLFSETNFENYLQEYRKSISSE